MNKLLIIVFLFLASCGYSPIYKSINKNNFIFSEIQLIGDQVLIKKIISNLNFKEDKINNSLNKVKLEAKKNTFITSKNSRGEVLTYRTFIELKLTVSNNNQLVGNKTFLKEFNYSNKENKFELKQYQAEIENNLILEIIEEINIYLNL